jgi:hypothetical protein
MTSVYHCAQPWVEMGFTNFLPELALSCNPSNSTIVFSLIVIFGFHPGILHGKICRFIVTIPTPANETACAV